MGRAELGTKCTCAGCGGRFYDLNRSPGICPKCGAEQPPEKARVARPARTSFGSLRLNRQVDPVFAADNAEPAATPDVEDPDADDADADDATVEPDDDEVEIDHGHGKVVAD
jgi:uncharacterized protein (TIGR02300 family)